LAPLAFGESHPDRADSRASETAMPKKNGKKDDTTPSAHPPHPFAVKRTELVWEGKYDADGRRRATLRIPLQFQTIETINESTQERQLLLERPLRREETWRNRLIWGDKKYVLPSLLPEFAGKVNLIYIDPPFDTGADFSFTANVPDHQDTEDDSPVAFTKEPSIIEQKAYRDTWGRGLDSYLQWFYETAVLLHELLAENGSLYVHLDWHVSFYAKVVLDEVFGAERFVNEIVWKRQTAKSDVTQGAMHMGRIHESILLYAKTENYPWYMQFTRYDESYLDSFYRFKDPDGRRYQLSDITAPGGAKASKGNPTYEFLGVTRFWRFVKQTMEKLYKEGRIIQITPGSVPRQKRYLDEMPGVPLQSLWLDIKPIQSQSAETVSYTTQKPEVLLERILKLSSNEDDLVLDCFCGSGTTATVAEKLKRRWTTCDLGRFSIHTTRKRLLAIEGVRPFVVQNLGKYERQAWQAGQFGDGESKDQQVARQRAYTTFILKLYNAKPVQGHNWLHGLKEGHMVHVGSVDGPVTLGDVSQIAAEFKKAIGKGGDAPVTNGVDLLGWDFAFELNEVARQQAAANIQMKFIRIPRDVMDKRAVEEGDIRFFELAALGVKPKVQEREVTVELTDFVIPPDDVPPEVRTAVKHWGQWIDYWAVDWDFKGDTFHNQWQAYRTRKEPTLKLDASHSYAKPGEYTVVVKVIDILGNDTTKGVKVKVK
jgi:DNA modification methylase